MDTAPFQAAGPPETGLWERLVAVLRGLWAVVAFLWAWIDEQVTALAGIAPLSPRLRAAGEAIAVQYRLGRVGSADPNVIDAEVVEDVFTPDPQGGS
ncbi:hypothetical protein [Actinomadura rudentiformis]|uniref:Uncharacterized protein n=1 Tax=Actinomadura rudentiformis TaxID=359158 RepID=A0A6H9YYK7_9ACTN|nr:hypothetical protein [Actinomadura rudentiformis]KAB2351613.1 hypothetical protein F8566_05150 [Actinomadura rudentiformis]